MWAHRQRKGRSTDAILSCPCCFTTVCIDCQHHALQHGQYRAMFTMNCRWLPPGGCAAPACLLAPGAWLPRLLAGGSAGASPPAPPPPLCVAQLPPPPPRRVDKSAPYEQPARKHAGRRTGKQARTGGQEALWRVLCEVCDTQLGVQDEDEVVHFVHVLASNA